MSDHPRITAAACKRVSAKRRAGHTRAAIDRIGGTADVAIKAWRARGWSVTSIARHLNLPEALVATALHVPWGQTSSVAIKPRKTETA